MPLVDFLKKNWVIPGALGLAALLLLVIRFALRPSLPPPPAAPTDSLASAPADSALVAAFFPPGSAGLQVAELIARRDFQQARQLLASIDRRALGAAEQRGLEFQQALCDQALGDARQASARLRQLQDAHPALEDHRRLWLVRALDEAGDRGAAIAAHGEFLAACQHPGLAEEARLRLAELYAESGDPRRALGLHAQLLAGGQAPAALARMVQLCEALPDPEAASRHRLQLLQEHPGHPLALKAAEALPAIAPPQEQYACGLVYFHHNRHLQAIQVLEAFLGAHPDHALVREAHYLLGRAYLGNRQYERARRTFAQGYEKHRYPAALYQLGVALVRLDRDPEAIQAYELFVRLYPQEELAPEALWQAARVAERLDRFSLAGQLYGRLAREYPASPYRDEARWASGFMAYCQRRYAQALERFTGLSRQATAPGLIDQSLFWAGKAAQRLGRRAEARRYFQEASNGFPRSYYSTRAFSMGYTPTPPAPPPSPAGAAPPGDPFLAGRAAALLQLGLLDLAEAELQDRTQLSPSEVAVLKALRDRCEALGLGERALRLSFRIFAQDQSRAELGHLYPRPYFAEIVSAAREAQVDPYLVLSVIRQESLFAEGAVSSAGAVGLMQIMPQNGLVLARQLGLSRFERDLLFDPHLSIRMGSHYLGELLRAFASGPSSRLGLVPGLAAYNANPQVVRRWLERFAREDSDAFIERIPYKETRLYVKLVLRNYTLYKLLSQT